MKIIKTIKKSRVYKILIVMLVLNITFEAGTYNENFLSRSIVIILSGLVIIFLCSYNDTEQEDKKE